MIDIRKIMGSINEYLLYEANELDEGQLSNVIQVVEFVRGSLIGNTLELLNMGMHDTLWKEICLRLDKEEIFKVLRSSKLRKELGVEHVRIAFNGLDKDSKLEYLMADNYVAAKDNFLVLDVVNEGIITWREIKDKIVKNSLEMYISNEEDLRVWMDLVNGFYLVKFINRKYCNLEEFKGIYTQRLGGILPLGSLVLKGDEEEIAAFLSDNPKLYSKVNYKVLANVYECADLLKIFGDGGYANVLEALYYKDAEVLKRVVKRIIRTVDDGFIPVNCYALIDKEEEFKKNRQLYLKFRSDVACEVITQNLSQEDIIDLLRDRSFVSKASKEVVTGLMSSVAFSYVFNLLQDNVIYEKVDSLTFSITGSEKSLVLGFLESIKLNEKINDRMVYKLLSMLDYEEVLVFLKYPYILNRLSDGELLDVLTIKNIDINELLDSVCGKRLLNRELLIEYVNRMWEVSLDLGLIKDRRVISVLYDLDDDVIDRICFEDVNYLFMSIVNKENLAMCKSCLSVLSYKSVIVASLILGVSRTLDLLFNSLGRLDMKVIKDYQRIVVNMELQDYWQNDGLWICNMRDYLDKKIRNYEGLITRDNLVSDQGIMKVVMCLVDEGFDLTRVLKVFNRYREYRSINEGEALQELDEFCNEFKGLIEKKVVRNVNERFVSDAKKLIRLKDSVISKRAKELNQGRLDEIKLKIMYALYKGDYSTLEFFRPNVNGSKKLAEFKDSVIKLGFDFEDYLDNILLPLSDNKFDEFRYLKRHGVLVPSSYKDYLQVKDDLASISELNKYFNKLSYTWDKVMMSELADCLLSGRDYKYKKREVRECRKILEDLRYDIYYDSVNNRFVPSNIVKSYEKSDDANYDEEISRVKDIVLKSRKFVKNHFVNQVIYDNYYTFLDIEEISSSDLDDYVVRDGIFNLNDLEYVFAGVDFNSCELMSDGYYKHLVEKHLGAMVLGRVASFRDFRCVLTNSAAIDEYVMSQGILMSRIVPQDVIGIFKKLRDEDVVLATFDVSDASYYEVVSPKYVCDVYGKCLGSGEKYLRNMALKYDEYVINDVWGLEAIKMLIKHNLEFRNIVKMKDLLKSVSEIDTRFYEIRWEDEYKGFIVVKVLGNCVLISEIVLGNGGKIASEVVKFLADKIGEENEYIDVVLIRDGSYVNSEWRFNGEYYVLMSKEKVSESWYESVYYGELVSLPQVAYQIDKEMAGKRVLNLLKINWMFDDGELDLEKDLEVFKDVDYILFDNWNVCIYKNEECVVHVNYETDYFRKLKEESLVGS